VGKFVDEVLRADVRFVPRPTSGNEFTRQFLGITVWVVQGWSRGSLLDDWTGGTLAAFGGQEETRILACANLDGSNFPMQADVRPVPMRKSLALICD
jgi:hypothetical protein